MDREIFDKYLSQQVLSASPAELVAMLHDRAILLLHDVVVAIEAGDVKRRWKSNSKATAIIAELWQSLDMERGAEIAENLNRLYGFMTMRLCIVDLENDAQAARDVIGLLEPLRASWREITASKERETSIPAGEGLKQISLSA